MLHRGDLFAGRYRVERCIGTGGMGAVYEAEHIETERKIALKVLLPQALVSEGARERFKLEARVAAKLRHPNIVDVIDAGVDDITAMPYLVMELLHGEDLGSRILRTGRMDPGEAVSLLAEVASALDRLHEMQIVHRDLKPENLFLAKGAGGARTVKILDFGVAKVIAEGKTSAFTQDAQGTPVYMAPEQFAEQIRISPATDIYALGMLTFALLTGKQYWGPEIERGMNVFMLARIAEGGPKEAATARALREGTELPAAFDEWFATTTALTPGERYPTAGDAIEALADAMKIDLRASSHAYANLDRSDPPDPGRGPVISNRAASGLARAEADRAAPVIVDRLGNEAVEGRSGGGYLPSPSPTSGLQSTPPIPLRRISRSSLRSWILTASLSVAVIVIGIGVALRVTRGTATGGSGTSVASSSSAAIAASNPTWTGTVDPPAVTTTTTSGDAPSLDPSGASTEPSPAATSTSTSSKIPPFKPSQRAPASSATATRKPKYTRD